MSGSGKETTYVGTPVSRGIVFGPVHVIARGFSAPDVYHVTNTPREIERFEDCLLYTSPSPRDRTRSRMPSSA